MLRWRLPTGLWAVIALAMAWQILAIAHPSLFVPSLQRVVASAWALMASGDLWLHVRSTMFRVVAGLCLGGTIGLLTGVWLAVSVLSSRLLQGVVTFFRQAPIFGLVPLISLWFGTGDLAKIVLVSIAAYFPVMLQTQEGIRNVPSPLVELGRALTFSRWLLLRRVLLPSAAPFIGTGVRQAVAFAWISGVGVELFMNTGAGLGSLLTAGRIGMRMDYILVGIAVIAVIGTMMNWIASQVEMRFFRFG